VKPGFVILDFDGVIMDSMGLKLESFCHALEGFGFSREAIGKLQLATAGLSRYKVIPLMYASLAGEAMPDELYREALARFNAHDEASRGKMVLKRGTEQFLQGAQALDVPLAVVTGTPQEVIDKTMEYFRLGIYFRSVLGSPGSKSQHLETLLKEFRLDPASCLFVGDAVKDQEAAAALGIPFAGVNNGDDPFRLEDLVVEIKTLDQLLPLIRG
jgi:phosphoglycolate phosphatase-like HAD superfamily hydrolase